MFDIDTTNLLHMRRWAARQPKQFRRGVGTMLNQFAYGTKGTTSELLARRMTIRNLRFINAHIRAVNARFSQPINQQKSIVGTTSGPRFSGFIEQEKGAPTERSRVASLMARGGSKSSQIKPSNRLKPGREIVDQNTYDVDNPGAVVAIAKRTKEKRLIRIKRKVYRLKGNKFSLIQTLKARNAQPRKRPFMQTSRKLYFRSVNLDHLWAKTINRLINKRMR